MRRLARGFTLTELLVAMGVGLLVVQISFASFMIVQKYVNRILRLEAANQALQAAITWHGYKGFHTYPDSVRLIAGTDYTGNFWELTAAGREKVSRMPYGIIVGGTRPNLALYDLSGHAFSAKKDGDRFGITGWLYSGDLTFGDPRVLAEITLPEYTGP